MNEEEITEFLEKVKGKKIRLGYWNAGVCFIPNGLRSDLSKTRFIGTRVWPNRPNKTNDTWNMGTGLGYWQFVDENSAPAKELSSKCKHEWVDIGFMHPKFVCKFCNIERRDK